MTVLNDHPMTAVNPLFKTMENPIPQSITDYPHTRRSLQLESGCAEKTIRRWIKKADVTGCTIGNIERFTNEQREQILSHQAKSKQTEETIEAELIEPGAIELRQADSTTASPLMRFELKPIELDLPTVDTSALAAQTQQLDKSAQQGAIALSSYFSARLDVGLAQIAAEQDNLLKGIHANALNGAARSVSDAQQKPGESR